MTRICNVCKIDKDLEEFHNCKSFPLGKVYTCKPCAKKKTLDWGESNRTRKRQKGREHYWQNKLPYLARSSKRYMHVKKNASPAWLTEDQLEQIEQFYWLAKDLKSVTGYEYHVDHIVPIKGKNVCGLHVPWNLQVLPYDINIAKHNKLEVD